MFILLLLMNIYREHIKGSTAFILLNDYCMWASIIARNDRLAGFTTSGMQDFHSLLRFLILFDKMQISKTNVWKKKKKLREEITQWEPRVKLCLAQIHYLSYRDVWSSRGLLIGEEASSGKAPQGARWQQTEKTGTELMTRSLLVEATLKVSQSETKL